MFEEYDDEEGNDNSPNQQQQQQQQYHHNYREEPSLESRTVVDNNLQQIGGGGGLVASITAINASRNSSDVEEEGVRHPITMKQSKYAMTGLYIGGGGGTIGTVSNREATETSNSAVSKSNLKQQTNRKDSSSLSNLNIDIQMPSNKVISHHNTNQTDQ